MTLQELKDTIEHHPNAEHVFIWHDTLSGWIRAGDVAEVLFADDGAANSRPNYNGPHNDNNVTAPNAASQTPASPHEHWYHAASPGLWFGVSVLIVGCSLFFLGMSGHLIQIAMAIGLAPELVDASPGALLFVLGLFVVWSTRDKIPVK
jgi:hypothetical protein